VGILDFILLSLLIAASCILAFMFFRNIPRKPWKAALLVTLLGVLFAFTLNTFILVVIQPVEYFSSVFWGYIFCSVFVYILSYNYFRGKQIEKVNQ